MPDLRGCLGLSQHDVQGILKCCVEMNAVPGHPAVAVFVALRLALISFTLVFRLIFSFKFF